jgi:hypothetical protein
MKGELANLDAIEQAELVEKVNPQLNAVITPRLDKARAQAQEARGGSLPDGPFRGVPFLLKEPGLRYRWRSDLRRHALVARRPLCGAVRHLSGGKIPGRRIHLPRENEHSRVGAQGYN